MTDMIYFGSLDSNWNREVNEVDNGNVVEASIFLINNISQINMPKVILGNNYFNIM